MKAVVLVGGEGTRLRPLTYEVPKQMLPIAQLPMIERVLEQLARHGVSEAVLSLGYKPEVFKNHFSSGKWRDMSLTFAVEPPTLLDTAGAIGFAARYAGISETFIAVNGDVLSDLDVTALVKLHRERGAKATIALTPVEDPSAFGVVPTESDGKVIAFIEKPKREEAPTNYINAGTYVLEPSVLELIPEGERVSIERVVFPALAAEGSLFALQSEAYWLDTGTAEKFVQGNVDYIKGLRPLPPHPAAELRGESWSIGKQNEDGASHNCLLGSDVIIDPSAKVENSIIGNGVQIAPRAVVRGSVLFDGVVVGESSVVENSCIGSNAKVHAGARIEGFSILGYGDEAPADSVIQNTRVGVE